MRSCVTSGVKRALYTSRFSTSTLVSGTNTSGFAGAGDYAHIVSSYSTGSIDDPHGAGFLCGRKKVRVTTSYWDTTTSGTDEGACNNHARGITGLTTEQLQSGLPVGFDPSTDVALQFASNRRWRANPDLKRSPGSRSPRREAGPL